MGAGALRRAQNGAQIVGVGNFVAHHQQRRLALFGGGVQQGLHGHILPHGRQGDDPLMGVGAAHAVQLAPVGLHHHDALFAGAGGDVAEGLVRFPLGQINFVNIFAGAQRLYDGVASLDDAVRLRLGQGLLPVVLSHSSSSLKKMYKNSIAHTGHNRKVNS